MKREKRLTKRERKALAPAPAAHAHDHEHHHIHCVACGRHLDVEMFDPPEVAVFIRCEHLTEFPSCVGCASRTKELLTEHDRTGQPVKTAGAWH
jgi:hypothetical protein